MASLTKGSVPATGLCSEASVQRRRTPATVSTRKRKRAVAHALITFLWVLVQAAAPGGDAFPGVFGTALPTSVPWLMRSKVAAVTLFFGILGALSAPAASLKKDPPIPIKVVIVTMFEAGADTGEPPGRLPELGGKGGGGGQR